MRPARQNPSLLFQLGFSLTLGHIDLSLLHLGSFFRSNSQTQRIEKSISEAIDEVSVRIKIVFWLNQLYVVLQVSIQLFRYDFRVDIFFTLCLLVGLFLIFDSITPFFIFLQLDSHSDIAAH